MHASSRTDQLHRELEKLGSKVGDLERALGRLTMIVADRLPPNLPDGTYMVTGGGRHVVLEDPNMPLSGEGS
jgi:hypothetical protein